jgi:hypothetical protein
MLVPLALAAAFLGGAGAQEGPLVVASCDFEGPYSEGDQQVHSGCANNWQWGRKDMLLRADTQAGRPGTVQMIRVRGIASGGMQFFYTNLKLKKDRYYRISYWLRSDGLEGPVRCYVRKIGYPWTVYVGGPYQPTNPAWQEYSLTGRCPEDVNEDVGVCWEGGSLGTIWIDDLKVEEADGPFPTAASRPVNLPTAGNLLPRSSFEGRRDHLWSTMFFGWSRDGVWEGVEGDWEDPQAYRAPDGKVGRYCLAVPSARHAGQAGTLSLPFSVLPGRPYTVSAWMKADPPGFPASLSLQYYRSGRHQQGLKEGAVYPKLTGEWQRVSFTTTPEPDPAATDANAPVQVALQIAPAATQQGTVYVDGITLEPGATAGEYRPAYPLELYADIGQESGNLLKWGDKVPLNLLVAAADAAPSQWAQVEVTVRGYPDVVVWKRTLDLPVGQETRLDLDLRRRGLLRVEMRTVDGTLAAPQEMVMALVPPPRPTGLRGMFGTHIAVRPALVRYVRQLGFTWTRLHDCSLLTKWSATERAAGQFLWHDEVVEGVCREGLNILGLTDHEPEWAKVATAGANPVNVAAFEAYCEAVARHYAGRIDHWEVWNEPYMPGSYSGGAQLFGEILQAGYRGLKRGNPNCRVLGWCADVSNPSWGASIPEEARACIDIFSFHNYANNLCGGGTLPFAAELPDHRKLWPPHVSECWNTEGTNGDVCGNGFYSHMDLATPETNQRATAFASRVWLEHARIGAAKYFVYQMHNVDTMSYYGGYQSLLIQYDRTPTPAAVAAAVTAYCIDGLQFRPCADVEGVVQALFTGEDRSCWAAYDDGGVPGRRRLSLAKLPAEAQVLDVVGNDPRGGRERDWEIGMTPLFVVSPKMNAERLAAACRAAIGSAPG